MSFEKRKNPRFNCSNPEKCPIDFKEHKGKGRLLNLSRSGIALQSSEHLEKDKTYQFEIGSHLLDRLISCEARVLWTREETGTRKHTCGARILQMDPSSKIDLLDTLYEDWKQKVTSNLL